ncbi:MAG: polysaccharide lyase family 1 protein [Actinomycetes bacterium]
MSRHRKETQGNAHTMAQRLRRVRFVRAGLGLGVASLASSLAYGGLAGLADASSPNEPAASYAPASALMMTRSGFGAETTGGLAGQMVHVTTDADGGPGSLRAALAGNTPAWIVFDGDYTIHFATGVPVGSNKTIDGRGRRVTLTGHGSYGLLIRKASNVIVENMFLTDFGDVTRGDNDMPDAIDVGASHDVWIDHNDLSVAGNKLISIQDGSTDVRVSWNHLHNQEQTFQIGDQKTAATAALQTVTVDHNFFDHTAYRNPVLSYGKAHVYNNYILGWKVFGVRSQRIGQMYLENNIFQPTSNLKASVIAPDGNGCNDAGTLCDTRLGYLKAVGNLVLGGGVIQTNAPTKVFTPSHYYAYTPQRATTSLASQIAAQAGWQSTAPTSRHMVRTSVIKPPTQETG